MLKWHLGKSAAAKAAKLALKWQEDPAEPLGETFILDEQAQQVLHDKEVARQKGEKNSHR